LTLTQVMQFPETRADDPCAQVGIMIAAMGTALQKQNLSEFCTLLRRRTRLLSELEDQGVTLPDEMVRELIDKDDQWVGQVQTLLEEIRSKITDLRPMRLATPNISTAYGTAKPMGQCIAWQG
jgi:hypothetical protein